MNSSTDCQSAVSLRTCYESLRLDPRLWKTNSATRITTAIGTMYDPRTGLATVSPSTALSTEIAGVMMPSPYAAGDA